MGEMLDRALMRQGGTIPGDESGTHAAGATWPAESARLAEAAAGGAGSDRPVARRDVAAHAKRGCGMFDSTASRLPGEDGVFP